MSIERIAEPTPVRDVLSEVAQRAQDIQNGAGSFLEKLEKLKALVTEYVTRREQAWQAYRVIITGPRVRAEQGWSPVPLGREDKTVRANSVMRESDIFIRDSHRRERGDVAHAHEEKDVVITAPYRDDQGTILEHEEVGVYYEAKAIERPHKTSVSECWVIVTFRVSEHGVRKKVQEEANEIRAAAGLQ